MILIISGTNRPGSLTSKIAGHYRKLLQENTNETVELFLLEDFQEGLLHADMYETSGQSQLLKEAQKKLFIPAKKWVVISPEYNGSYPGALKVLLDALSVNEPDLTFKNKKVALIGISSGRAGNWLGMDQLTSVLQYLNMHVFYSKPALRQIGNLLNEHTELSDSKTVALLEKHATEILLF